MLTAIIALLLLLCLVLFFLRLSFDVYRLHSYLLVGGVHANWEILYTSTISALQINSSQIRAYIVDPLRDIMFKCSNGLMPIIKTYLNNIRNR